MGQFSSKDEKRNNQENINFIKSTGSSEQLEGYESTLVNTTFKWKQGGSIVYLTGTFTDWKNHIRMPTEGVDFSIILKIPKGIHFYKFIVDGQWKVSSIDESQLDDKGNLNNVIDTRNYEVDVCLEESPLNDIPEEPNEKQPYCEDNHFQKINQFNLNQQLLEFTEEPPSLPPHIKTAQYLQVLDIIN